MRHRRTVLAAVAFTLLSVAACSDDAKQPTAAPAPTESIPAEAGVGGPEVTEPPATGTAKPAFTKNPDGTTNRSGAPRPATGDTTISAGGLGPYKIGVSQATLKSTGLFAGAVAKKSCTGYTGATGLARFGSPDLVFYKGRLLYLSLQRGGPSTAKGTMIDTAVADVKRAYPGGKQLDDWTGATAWLAPHGDYTLLFAMKNDKVAVIQAGMAEPLQFRFTDRQGC
ncbi:hypothetical protein EV385_2309 [Krasilnikovia cinnamomea]|uniref:Uncharacterized protein n=1 Tax=Krasilnikovia cinnamomea TaxID=349313 RepID=A0A4Q7ZI73_9ACTN|nr:hypothetical protein [Krasilnikovia cinnamomea]RZU50537.1 hypothetical protein EV385_2309 [Krasilnikovia cinnamomea]